MSEYPKQLINDDGAVVLAKQAVHEADLRRQGFYDPPVAPESEPPVSSETVECASCAALRAEVEDLKAKLAKALEPLTGVGNTPKVRKPRKPKE